MKSRVFAGVVGGWLFVGVLWGTQTAIGASLQNNPVALATAVRSALLDSLPWVPVILIVISLATRFPVARETWKRAIWIHLLALPLVALVANMLVVLQFGLSTGSVPGIGTLISQGLFWATVRIHVAALLYVAVAGLTHGFRYHRFAVEAIRECHQPDRADCRRRQTPPGHVHAGVSEGLGEVRRHASP